MFSTLNQPAEGEGGREGGRERESVFMHRVSVGQIIEMTREVAEAMMVSDNHRFIF